MHDPGVLGGPFGAIMARIMLSGRHQRVPDGQISVFYLPRVSSSLGNGSLGSDCWKWYVGTRERCSRSNPGAAEGAAELRPRCANNSGARAAAARTARLREGTIDDIYPRVVYCCEQPGVNVVDDSETHSPLAMQVQLTTTVRDSMGTRTANARTAGFPLELSTRPDPPNKSCCLLLVSALQMVYLAIITLPRQAPGRPLQPSVLPTRRDFTARTLAALPGRGARQSHLGAEAAGGAQIPQARRRPSGSTQSGMCTALLAARSARAQ